MLRLLIVVAGSTICAAQTGGRYHLTARPWSSLDVPPARYLDAIEGECRFTAPLQDGSGAIIDPFIGREHQYATPYFAHAVGTLVHAGRGKDLLPSGVRAMEHATGCFGRGRDAVPDQHGEFFIAALTEALQLYEKHVPREQWLRWRDRMKLPSAQVIGGGKNNWETYVMKGDWIRAMAGLIPREGAVSLIEEAWLDNHSKRIAAAPWLLYHDRTSDPDTLSVEAVGRGNLLAMIAAGYDGPSAARIREIVETATANTMLLQDPSGQAPTNGRTDNHVWVEIGYQLAFEVMAERAWQSGDRDRAGQFRRAALLAFQSAQRWRRSDGKWAGSYYVTKNRFDPALRVGHQPASQYTNYNGSLMFHLSEALHARQTEIPQRPTPSEIGGYAFQLDEQFASAFANAGGMLVQANLRGQEKESHANYWSPLGIVRFARAGWETRLGPSDGAFDGKRGVSFAPAFQEKGTWLRMADLPTRYQAKWSVEFTHPMLVRCSITYEPKQGHAGPVFRNDLVITPAGVLSEVRQTSGDKVQWGVTWPLLESDGTPLRYTYAEASASTSFGPNADEQSFLALSSGARIEHDEPVVRSTYGDLRPVLMTVGEPVSRTFVYPHSPGDPSAEEVRRTWKSTAEGFTSALGRLSRNVWTGRTSAGGVGDQLDLNGDGKPEVRFGASCGFIARIDHGAITELETDRDVSAVVSGKTIRLRAWTPFGLRIDPKQ